MKTKRITTFAFRRTRYFQKCCSIVGEQRFLRRSCIDEARYGGPKPERPNTLRGTIARARTIERNSKIVDVE